MGRDRFPTQSLGTLYEKIKRSRILLVGAGGIGCELLKNLVLTGFGEIHIIDLDTIDLSNLNRQFLFRHEHIKKSKALVAKESASKFNPLVKLEAHHANIKDPQFNLDFFQSFTLVFNALDNLDARRYVNRMCLAAGVPLIESGTTGFNGQVQVIQKGKTECYDCTTKETPKTFPVCTIRSTPSLPIHCIVWAKSYLFTEIFGTSEDEMPEFDHSEDSKNVEEIEKLRQESHALKDIRGSMGSDDLAYKIFDKVFKTDINRLLGMEDMWKTRKAPHVLEFMALSAKAQVIESSVAQQDLVIWSEVENFKVFCDSLERLSARCQKASNSEALVFDKDDEDILDFIASSANLRSIVFGLEIRSKFDIKQMAGNIIPAIATTNAMTAALCVLQAFKVMREELGRARMIFLERSVARVINSDTLKPPNPECTVCGVIQSRLIIDSTRATLNDLVEDVLRKQLGYGEEFTVNNEVGTLYDPELDDNLSKKLSELNVKADSFLLVIDDDDDNPRVNLSLSISERTLSTGSDPIVLSHKLNIPRKPSATSTPTTSDQVDRIPSLNGANMKRKRSLSEPEDGQQQTSKRGKGSTAKTDDDLIFLDDSGNGAIVIEDE